MKKELIMLFLFPLLINGCTSSREVASSDEIYDASNRTPLNANEISYSFPNASKYQNPLEVDGQWGGVGKDRYYYGIGDPFVMRYNGKYYLYPSTEGPNRGVKVYTSDDMITWEYRGYAVANDDETTANAYAPEVIYYKGYFYLCQSKGGTGHYFYKSDNPLGPFTRITGNLGRGIDGSFHVNDDGTVYLIHTNVPAGLRMSKVLDFESGVDETVLAPQVLVEEANLNHWIEGPNTIRRNDVTFLTYTGNHVGSKGYRVAYSYTQGNNFGPRDFTQHTNSVTLISTKDKYNSLGHSSNFYGPDLDSIYTGYHNRDSYGRRYNLDRYLTNGNRLISAGAMDNQVNFPAIPTYKANDSSEMVLQNNLYLSQLETEKYYTADLNFIPNSGYIVLDYKDSNNYLKLTIKNGSISLSEIVNGNEKNITSNTFGSEVNVSKLINVRIEKDTEKYSFYLNEMLKLQATKKGVGGKIGYNSSSQIYYTSFSNEVNGTSDFEAIKYLPTSIPAQAYLKSENRGYYFSDSITNNPIRLDEKNTIIEENGQYSVVLSKKDDFVKYPLVAKKGNYSLVLEVDKSSKGSIFEVILNDEKIIKIEVPEDVNFGDSQYLPLALSNFELDGNTSFKIRLFKGNLKFKQLDFYDDSEQIETENLVGETLLSTISSPANGKFILDGDAIKTNQNDIFMGLVGQNGVSNFEYSVDISFINGSQDGGIVFRTKNYSYHPDQPVQSFQGYYLQLKERVGTLFRYDYGANVLKVVSLLDDNNNPLFTANSLHRIKVICIQNHYTIYLDDKVLIDYYDSEQFMNGKVGFYTNKATYNFTNVSYKKI
jgi:hypothetical protein